MNLSYSIDSQKYIFIKNIIQYNFIKKEYLNIFVVGLVISLLLFVNDYSTNYTVKSVSDLKTTYYDWHLSRSLALVIIIIITFLLFAVYIRQGKFMSSVAKKALLFKGNNTFIEITEEKIIHQNSLIKLEIAWDLIESYRFFKHYILLKINQDTTGIIVDKKMITEEEYEILAEFLVIRRIPKK